MKKIGVLIIFLSILIIAINVVNATPSIFNTALKANNISGYICDNGLDNAKILTLFFSQTHLDPNSFTLTKEVPKDLTFNKCGGGEFSYSFELNIFKLDQTDLSGILDRFPVAEVTLSTLGAVALTPISKLNFSCMYPNQTIMKLNKALNAHVYLGNQSTLKNLGKDEYPICYERVFGYPYEGSSTIYPSSASCTSLVLYKHQAENSHIARSSVTGYTTKLCYADLQCNYRTLACNAGEKPVISLFYSNNSHASDSVDSNYAIKMCCTTSYVPNPISETNWYNMLGNQISSADKCDWVQIGAWGTNLVGQDVRFDIKNSARTRVYSKVSTTPASSSPQIAWQTIGDNTFNFDALLVSNLALNRTSNNLVASNNINSSDYNITLITPKCGNNFTINNDVNFNIFMNTTKNLIDGTISFGDGQTATFSNIGSNIATFTHRYTTDGTKTITIETRPVIPQVTGCPDLSYLVKRKRINIIIINLTKSGEYVAACIDSPEDLSRINQQTVFCNASSTRAINYSTTTGYIIIPHTKLSFKWGFSDQTIHEFRSILNSTHIPPPEICYDTIHEYTNPGGERYNHTISCDVPSTTGTTFTKYFQIAGDHYADLLVSIM